MFPLPSSLTKTSDTDWERSGGLETVSQGFSCYSYYFRENDLPNLFISKFT